MPGRGGFTRGGRVAFMSRRSNEYQHQPDSGDEPNSGDQPNPGSYPIDRNGNVLMPLEDPTLPKTFQSWLVGILAGGVESWVKPYIESQYFNEARKRTQNSTGLDLQLLVNVYFLFKAGKAYLPSVLNLIKEVATSSVEIPAHHPGVQNSVKNFVSGQVEATSTSWLSLRTQHEVLEGGNGQPQKEQKGVSWRFFWFRRTLFYLEMHGRGEDIYSDIPSGQMFIHCLGRSTQPIHAFILHCQKKTDMLCEINVKEMKLNDYSDSTWSKQPNRPPSTIDLEPSLLDEILGDAERFFHESSKKFYMSTGHPYRKGYLFYGPPGTGKTSLCQAIATHLRLKIVKINTGGMDDGDLETAFKNVPKKCLVLLEDIDCVKVSRRPQGSANEPSVASVAPSNDPPSQDTNLGAPSEGRKFARSSQNPPKEITLSGLLNVIDGVSAPTERLLIMTCNGPRSLDPALLRPGRVDLIFKIDYATKTTAEMTFKRVYGQDELRSFTLQAIDRMAKAFREQFPHKSRITTAQVENYCMAKRDQPHKAVQEFRAWLHRIKTGEDGLTYDINDIEDDASDPETNLAGSYDPNLLKLTAEDYIVPPKELHVASLEDEAPQSRPSSLSAAPRQQPLLDNLSPSESLSALHPLWLSL